MQNTNTPAPVSAVELTQRQLRDWKQLKANLLANPTPTHEIALDVEYCDQKIEELEVELTRLNDRL